MSYYLLLFLNILLITLAQLLLKKGTEGIAEIVPDRTVFQILVSKLTNLFILAGAFSYFMSFVLWIYILSKSKVSYVYPLMSLSYVAVMALSIFFFKEKITTHQWIGATFIVLGTSFILYKH